MGPPKKRQYPTTKLLVSHAHVHDAGLGNVVEEISVVDVRHFAVCGRRNLVQDRLPHRGKVARRVGVLCEHRRAPCHQTTFLIPTG